MMVAHGSGRLFRRRASLRYVGAVHEEVAYLPEPARTTWSPLGGGPHIAHVGYDPRIYRERGKGERNTRLLGVRLAQDPDDPMTHRYLAREHALHGRHELARTHARRALASPRWLGPRYRAELEQLLAAA
jgi:hypothetical protein